MDEDMVSQTCGESYQCMYDYSTSLSREFAIFTKYYQDQFVNIREGVLKPEARGEPAIKIYPRADGRPRRHFEAPPRKIQLARHNGARPS